MTPAKVYSIKTEPSATVVSGRKTIELATLILKDDKKWDKQKIIEAMNSGGKNGTHLKIKNQFTLAILPLG
jgi:hypothetical protein